MEPGLEKAVRELVDRQAIHDCLMRYSRGVDRLDRELLLSVYHADGIDDHGMFVGGREEFADWVIDMHSTTHHSQQHCLLNHTVDIDGTTAHAETYYMFVGMNKSGPPCSISGGRYIDRFENRDGIWAVAHRVCIRDWILTDEPIDPDDPAAYTAVRGGLPGHLIELMSTATRSSRDLSDASYSRPFAVDPKRVEAGRRTGEAGK